MYLCSNVIFSPFPKSHTHFPQANLAKYTWKNGANVIGDKDVVWKNFKVGEHTLTLTVEDDQGNESTDTTVVVVHPYGFPYVSSLSQSSGSTDGGNNVTIKGSGFTYPASETIVHFGIVQLTGSDLEILDDRTIAIVVPPATIAAPVEVKVQTPIAEEASNSISYVYVAGVPIDFASGLLVQVDSPTVARFDNNGVLYVGTVNGHLGKFELNDDFTQVVTEVVSLVSEGKAILGIAFDPTDTQENNKAYISTSSFFHGDPTSTSGESINGAILSVSGNNLDLVEEVITGRLTLRRLRKASISTISKHWIHN